jgi:hypothetical protein
MEYMKPIGQRHLTDKEVRTLGSGGPMGPGLQAVQVRYAARKKAKLLGNKGESMSDWTVGMLILFAIAGIIMYLLPPLLSQVSSSMPSATGNMSSAQSRVDYMMGNGMNLLSLVGLVIAIVAILGIIIYGLTGKKPGGG